MAVMRELKGLERDWRRAPALPSRNQCPGNAKK